MADGARERGKARRREAILRAAYELFAERGFDATTVADVAGLAEVSPRTVTLYFPTKLDLATSYLEEFTDRLSRSLAERAEGVTTLGALEAWLREDVAASGELDALWERMIDRNPQLKAIANSRITEAVQEGARIFAAERGADPDSFAPRMVAAAAAAVIAEVYLDPSEAAVAGAVAFLGGGIAALSDAAHAGG
ncbi:TetR family transcriptional regulator [Kitasatospora sp. NA04385]|uniref:TetR/AcrR family transcriptional regulator n=1 Tax=Kitasatospora sp. NA04385 TaxID=2742135 RepID=UPI00158FC817|nr:TetR family transcriptional regulator [Kitasatospora sp. NA04385]QKW22354.1 TetR family transcriptional regulator [Kitasatospora sp. NA04385]